MAKNIPAFQVHDVTHEGMRGRPSHPKAVTSRRERIVSRGVELGEVAIEADGSALTLTVVSGGRKKSFNFSAAPAKRGRAPKKATKARARKAA
jgi:hypothetical protein